MESISRARGWTSQALSGGLDSVQSSETETIETADPFKALDIDHDGSSNLPSLDEIMQELKRVDDPESDSGLEDDQLDEASSSSNDWDETVRPEEEDWEVAEKDFTKQYNRLRQHAAVYNRTASSFDNPTSRTKGQKGTNVVSLPAVNKPKSAKLSNGASFAAPVAGTPKTIASDQLALLQKYNSRLSRINEPYVGMGASVNRKGPSATANKKDKADRATTEQVLDPRTRLILYKMIGREVLSEVNGCISTGKEANVYHASNLARRQLAVKIYKTSILVFKDRDRYVTGEYRFRRGYARHNPRKMVRLWAEKEMRNLKRLHTAGIRCPEPLEVRENVLVMEFLGDGEGWASPRLKDATMADNTLHELYIEMLITVRRLYHQCKLVHADLSEYNVLFHQEHLYIIDVSQSVEHDHPHGLEFLRSDLSNVELFWGRRGVKTLGLRKAFEFVVSDGAALRVSGNGDHPEQEADIVVGVSSTDSNESYSRLSRLLTRWIAEAPTSPEPIANSLLAGEVFKSDHTQEDAVFKNSYIPRNLKEVIDPERDMETLKKGDGKSLIYAGLTGIADNTEMRPNAEQQLDDMTFLGSDTSEDDDEDRRPREKKQTRKDEDKEAKKERQRLVKEEAREKRKTKMPKAEKQQKVRRTKRW